MALRFRLVSRCKLLWQCTLLRGVARLKQTGCLFLDLILRVLQRWRFQRRERREGPVGRKKEIRGERDLRGKRVWRKKFDPRKPLED